MSRIRSILKISIWSVLGITAMGFLTLIVLVVNVERELPDVGVLKDFQLQIPLRVFTANGKLIAEFGAKRRNPVPYDEIPKDIVHAVLATEDQRFFEHSGVDIYGLARAAVQLLLTGTKSQGGSTITMQVARNFFLTSKKTYTRKLKEILLAIKIDHELSKEKILDLYLNKIYLGNHAYGVAAAAQVYYGKPLEELNLAQLAMIAGLPKAPSNLNPLANKEAALKRRNHVLHRMLERNYITYAAYDDAVNQPITAKYHGLPITVKAGYVAEMVRREIINEFGNDAYAQGLNIYTTLDTHLQQAANQALHNGLINYDQRHGFQKPLTNYGTPSDHNLSLWLKQLKTFKTVSGLRPAVVLSVQKNSIAAMLSTGKIIYIPWQGLSWARKRLSRGYVGHEPRNAKEIVSIGDVIRVEQLKNKQWALSQMPQAQGALIAIDPNNGAVLALTGGFDFKTSKFNRVTQAARQPGSSFKPFVYSAALAKGFTLSSIINDAPIVINDPNEEDYWRPQNDTRRFYGPTPLRKALSKSRNLVSIRLLQAIGIPYTLSYLTKFGFDMNTMPNSLSLALGTGTVTPLQLATAYTVFANGGYRITPFLITRITDSRGQLIYQAQPSQACNDCELKQKAPQAISPQVAYLMTLALQDVINNGTGRYALKLKRKDLAGKTGTTNEQKDAWFAGFNHNLVTVAWVGYDQPQSLHEYASKVALPIWTEFMGIALKGKPGTKPQQPSGLVTVKIDPKTGLLADPGSSQSAFETFREQYAPTTYATQTDHPGTNNSDDDGVAQLF